MLVMRLVPARTSTCESAKLQTIRAPMFANILVTFRQSSATGTPLLFSRLLFRLGHATATQGADNQPATDKQGLPKLSRKKRTVATASKYPDLDFEDVEPLSNASEDILQLVRKQRFTTFAQIKQWKSYSNLTLHKHLVALLRHGKLDSEQLYSLYGFQPGEEENIAQALAGHPSSNINTIDFSALAAASGLQATEDFKAKVELLALQRSPSKSGLDMKLGKMDAWRVWHYLQGRTIDWIADNNPPLTRPVMKTTVYKSLTEAVKCGLKLDESIVLRLLSDFQLDQQLLTWRTILDTIKETINATQPATKELYMKVTENLTRKSPELSSRVQQLEEQHGAGFVQLQIRLVSYLDKRGLLQHLLQEQGS